MATPLVSVVLAARDAEATVGEAVDGVLRQTVHDLELIVVDDGSVDGTGDALEAVGDPRLRVLRNEKPLGLAGALNRGLDVAGGTYVARMDADDVALPRWLERVVSRIRSRPSAAVVGTGTIDLHENGALGTVHRMPAGALGTRWAALFSSPFFHPTVIVDRAVLERDGLRYDTSFGESEDYDLWTRLFEHADGDNLSEALVLKRVHPGQASVLRRDVQESFQRRVALREIGRFGVDAEAVWRGSRGELLQLLRAFERRHGVSWPVRRAALRRLVRR